MRYLFSDDQALTVGVRCSTCDRFYMVAEGACIPLCHGMTRQGYRIEHHTMACLDECGVVCSCPCHEYRERENVPR